jgi:hypothetical protein
MTPDSLHISLDVPEVVPADKPVPIVIRLKNDSGQPVDLYLRGRTIAFDIFINRADGQLAWQRLKDEVVPAIVQLKTLRPGEVLELKHEWDQRGNKGEPVTPGAYVIRGAVLTDSATALQTGSASLLIQRS